MNIYVGNISRETNENEIKEAFEAFGQVSSVNIIKDKFSGDSRGFGFVEMPTASEAQNAIANLNGKQLSGRNLVVNEARPRSEGGGAKRGGGGDRPRGGGGGYRRSW